jgi:hypothetical protein
MGESNYTGAALEQALASGELDSGSTTLTGMVKASDKQGYVAFSLTGCGSWVDIPSSMIERAERAGTQTCAGHSHPVMRIALKAPSTAEGQILLALLNQSPGGAPPYAVPGDAFPGGTQELAFPGGTPGFAMPFAGADWLKCFGGTTPCHRFGRCNYRCCRSSPSGPWSCTITGPAFLAPDGWFVDPF